MRLGFYKCIMSVHCIIMFFTLIGILRIYARSGVVEGPNETVVTRKCSIKVNWDFSIYIFQYIVGAISRHL
jgi:hypothetical protein